MTRIRVTCDLCGDVEFPVDYVSLEPGRYRFDCPQCGVTQRRPAGDEVMQMLVSVGVGGLGPITEDEIERFIDKIEGRQEAGP